MCTTKSTKQDAEVTGDDAYGDEGDVGNSAITGNWICSIPQSGFAILKHVKPAEIHLYDFEIDLICAKKTET